MESVNHRCFGKSEVHRSADVHSNGLLYTLPPDIRSQFHSRNHRRVVGDGNRRSIQNMIRMCMGQQHRICLNILRLRYRSRVTANKRIDNQRLAAYLKLYTGMAVKNNLHLLSLLIIY
ncbi:hypothetical protein D3C80_1549650 [compost metagenome]